MGKQMGNVIGNSMKNGLQINLKDAIEDAGVKVPSSTCLWQYPEIIRKNLIAKTVSKINIFGKDIISISSTSDDNSQTYNISTIYDTKNVSRPNFANANTKWGKELSVDEIFNDLFSNILPVVRGVLAADMTVTDGSGVDTKEWNNTLFKETGIKTGLDATSKYLRLYLTCQAEPLFIYIDSAVKNLTNGYNVESSDSIEFMLDDENMKLTAHVASITEEQLKSFN